MKRSKMIYKIKSLIEKNLDNLYMIPDAGLLASAILEFQEREGMVPPPVPAKVVMGEDYPWGAGCSSRCNCNNCNPNYPVHSWEPE